MKTLLIANRGEIAARVIRSARAMGLRTVAVYSDADEGALHVGLADQAVRLGPPPAAESYLDASAILAAARATGADAIHPGYGFLSENPDFAEAVADAGLSFVGPPASAIRAMGLKDAAKAKMEAAGVPVVPGYHGAGQDPALLADEAARIGYPVLIKARAGGGGKGMRLVEEAAAFPAALEGAQAEAKAAFGDPAVLVEKFVQSPRHVEIQILADAHGTVLHLFERDCSLQRRHQKVLEEAPAPGMPAEVRAAMGAAAVEAARAIGYVGAGTVEFIADGSAGLRPGGFWFMEMNTRLQVEHPVTEAITGLDLVAWQLRVAAGEALPLTQDDLTIDGHAVEVRLYAEDAARGFLPATGTLDQLHFPPHAAFAPGPVRIDSGVRQGDAISPHYDPMIAKIIAHGATRDQAMDRLAAALAGTRAAGTVTNLAFLQALVADEDVRAARLDTGLISAKGAALTAPPEPDETALALAAVAALGLLDPPKAATPWDRLTGFRAWGPATHQVGLLLGEVEHTRTVTVLGADRYEVAGTGVLALTARPEDGAIRLTAQGQTRTAHIHRTDGSLDVFLDDQHRRFALPDPLAAAEEGGGGDTVTAPMPGLVKRLTAAAGQSVDKGAALAVLEAMKMEHTLTAPRAGEVAEVLVAEGDQVSDGALLLRLAPHD